MILILPRFRGLPKFAENSPYGWSNFFGNLFGGRGENEKNADEMGEGDHLGDNKLVAVRAASNARKALNTAAEAVKDVYVADVTGRLAAAGLMSIGGKLFQVVADKYGRLRAVPCNCFVAGTLVLTDNGLVPIETIKVGDKVAARDDKTGESEFREVLQLFGNPDKAVLNVEFTDALGTREIFEVTAEHPFMTENGWVEASKLMLGMQLKTYDGRALNFVNRIDEGVHARTYNFEVDEFHTYFVGRSGVWVHNSGDCWKMTSIFGHAFRYHGSGKKIAMSLADTARTTGTPQGQWMNNAAAAQLISSQGIIKGVTEMNIPPGLSVNTAGENIAEFQNAGFNPRLSVFKAFPKVFVQAAQPRSTHTAVDAVKCSGLCWIDELAADGAYMATAPTTACALFVLSRRHGLGGLGYFGQDRSVGDKPLGGYVLRP